MAFTMPTVTVPTVMENFTTAHIKVVAVRGLESAEVLMTWGQDPPDPLVRSAVRTSEAFVPRPGSTLSRAEVAERQTRPT